MRLRKWTALTAFMLFAAWPAVAGNGDTSHPGVEETIFQIERSPPLKILLSKG